MSPNPDHPRAPRAVTLVELLVALVIVAVCSTAVAVLLTGAGKTNAYVNSETQALSEVENAYRRIMHNLRTASSLDDPVTANVSQNTLEIHTQVDPSNGNTAADVKYYLSGTNLVEYDSRYNTTGSYNTLVNGCSSFTVKKISSSSPTQVTITIVSNTTPQISRTATITCRNF